MKSLRALLLAVLWCPLLVLADGVTNLGNDEFGTHYQFTVTLHNGSGSGLTVGGYGYARFLAYVRDKNNAFVKYLFDQSFQHPGLGSWKPSGANWGNLNESFGAVFVVPPGDSYTITYQYSVYTDDQGSTSNWSVTGPSQGYPGVSGTGYQPPTKKQITWAIPENTTGVPMDWMIFDNVTGAVVGHHYQEAGGAAANVMANDLPTDADPSRYVLKYWVPGAGTDGFGAWVAVTPATTVGAESTTGAGVTPPAAGKETLVTAPIAAPVSGANVVSTGTPPSAVTSVKVNPPTVYPRVPPQPPGTGGVTWNATSTGTGLTDALFKEGVDKLYNQANGAYSAFGTAKSADDAASGKGYGGSKTGAGTGTQAKSDLESAYNMGNGKMSDLPTMPSGSTSPFQLTTAMFGTINFDPGNSAPVSTAMTWVKALLAWALTGMWSYWVFKHFRELTGVGAVPQLRGHDVALGAGGQATALGNAVVWTTIMLALPVAFTAALNTAGLSMPSTTFLSTSPINALSGLGDAGMIAAKLVGYMVPWDTLVLCLIGPILVQAFSIPIYLGVQGAIRWLIA